MVNQQLEPEAVAQQLGAGGVDNLVENAERICGFQQQHIELSNQGTILSLQLQYNELLGEERRIENLLLSAPPIGDLRRLRRRAIYFWALTTVLAISGFAFTVITLAPFQLGWMSWLFAGGIAVLTPFLIDKLLEHNELLVKILNAVATVTAVASLLFLAEIRGNLLEQQMRQNQEQAVVIDDAQPPAGSENTFYEQSGRSLRLAMLFLAFSMEIGAGLALREAWRSMPDTSENWKALRAELAATRHLKATIARLMIDLRNEPGIFAARFWRDFYRAMLSNAVRSAMTKLLVLALAVSVYGTCHASTQDHLDLVIAIDLTRSVAVLGPDDKSEYQKNVDGVARVLSQVPAGSRVTVIGITDHSFSQPYILLSAKVGADTGYFGERLNSARNQLHRAWKVRAAQLNPHFVHTDVFGALKLASQVFAQDLDACGKILVIFSDMRQSTPELDLESQSTSRFIPLIPHRLGPVSALQNVKIRILGVDGSGRSSIYWQGLRDFWESYFQHSGAVLQDYTVLRQTPETATIQ